MICLIASSRLQAARWAASQHLTKEEWFHPGTVSDLYNRGRYHTITVLEGIEEVPNHYLNMMLTTAWREGRKT